jgi:UDP-N-acetyl-D-mannosaminuronic acid dehydrogenase
MPGDFEVKASNHYDVCVVGLGYVGLTLATVLSEVGLRVIGVEKRKNIVTLTEQGIPHFSEAGLGAALARVTKSGMFVADVALPEDIQCDAYIITVGTPLNERGVARTDMIESATLQVAERMQDNSMVILRSTVKIGTARKIVAPILRGSGKRFQLAMCPERTLEGKALQELRELPQIIGADTPEVRDRAAALFRRITNSVVQVTSLESAETIKLVDNTFRDVQFAFANEVARVCDTFGINAHEVITSGKLGYQRTNVPFPGLVGGPCLEKDPHILRESARDRGIELEITAASRLVNERQPQETVRFILQEADRRGIAANAKVAVLGIAFKGQPATDDLRGSMSLKVIDALRDGRPETDLRLFDPVATQEELSCRVPGAKVAVSLREAVTDTDIVIIANNHPALAELSPLSLQELMGPQGFIYDYWNHFSNLSPVQRGNSYFAVGNCNRGATS